MKKVTLDVIASELNISKNTVSKALRGMPGVSDDLRERIIKLSADKGYTHMSAPASTSVSIDLICRKSFFDEPTFWSQVFFGIWDYAEKKHISIRTITIGENKEFFSEMPPLVGNGIIIVGTVNDEFLIKISETGIPIVVVDHHSYDIECDYVNTANKNGVYQAIKHLYKNGHTKIGFINNIDKAYSFSQRYEGFLFYMETLELAVDERFVWHDAVYLNTRYYVEKINMYKHLPEFPTAWICVNDNTAMVFYHALTSIGYKVPDDISIIGFDNIASLYAPFLTTIDVPQKAMGNRAMRQLLYRIKHPNDPFESIQLNTKLIERSSVKTIS